MFKFQRRIIPTNTKKSPFFLVCNALLLSLYTSVTYAYIHPFETTRLKSTAGAGVASLLVEESTVLNPASIAFFDLTSLYVQRVGSSKSETVGRYENSYENQQIGVTISDSNPGVSGSLSYFKYGEAQDKRETFALSMATPFSEKSSVGVNVKRIKDEIYQSQDHYSVDKYTQYVFGITHAIKENLTVGLVVNDPMAVRPSERKIIIGSQYVFADFISLLLDLGSDFKKDYSTSLMYKTGIQFCIFEDFFLRGGVFNDKALSEKGSGVGVGWVQPRLSLEGSLKNTKQLENKDLAINNGSVKETSFSLSLRF